MFSVTKVIMILKCWAHELKLLNKSRKKVMKLASVSVLEYISSVVRDQLPEVSSLDQKMRFHMETVFGDFQMFRGVASHRPPLYLIRRWVPENKTNLLAPNKCLYKVVQGQCEKFFFVELALPKELLTLTSLTQDHSYFIPTGLVSNA